MSTLTNIISYIALAGGVISFLATALIKVDKKHATLWTDVKNIADAVVAQQAITDKSNETKKKDATTDLINQVEALGHNKLTETVAKGAIEQAVTRAKDTKVEVKAVETPEPEEVVLDDLHL